MPDSPLPFFGEAWCNLAREVANTTPDLRRGFVDPAAFTLVLAFACTDQPALTSWAEFRGGLVQDWRPGHKVPGGYVVSLRAGVNTWREAAEGTTRATDLLIGRQIKIRDPKNRIAANYNAFDTLLASWEEISTEWPDSK